MQIKVKTDQKMKIFTLNGITFRMLPVQGTAYTKTLFNMQGSEGGLNLTDFYMGEYLVTQALYRAVMACYAATYLEKHNLSPNPSYFAGDNLPVEQVSWNDTVHFLKTLNELTADDRKAQKVGEFALPSEAQWEYAARGGIQHTDNYEYAGCRRADLHNYAWYDENSGEETKPVGFKLPNQLGLYDMSGNVWEWCYDWHDSGFYKTAEAKQQNPRNDHKGEYRVLRGGR
ncbi:MAG: hypothetical protein RI894_89, partial [Bacteroidota bacterium]